MAAPATAFLPAPAVPRSRLHRKLRPSPPPPPLRSPPPAASAAPPPATLPYGNGPDQVGDLYLPRTTSTSVCPHPTVVLLHGGFWQEQYQRDLMGALAEDLAGRAGLAVWNLEYGRVRGSGGWPGTFEDVAAGLDFLAGPGRNEGVDPDRVVVMGHSAGGHLAAWAALRSFLPPDAPGVGATPPALTPCGVVAVAGVLDLGLALRKGVGAAAVTGLVGDPPSGPLASLQSLVPRPLRRKVPPGRLERTCPTAVAVAAAGGREGFGGGGGGGARQATPPPFRLLSGELDRLVPASLGSSFAGAARGLGADVREEVVRGEGHFDVLNPRSASWAASVAAAEEILAMNQ